MERNLVTVKKASEVTGDSRSFLRQLMREQKLKKYKVNRAVYLSLKEFEQLAQPEAAA